MSARIHRPKGAAVNINLLPKDSFSASSAGKILEWALSSGRYIVVFTEMIVILTFLQRFNLDRQLSNLNESIYQRVPVLESYSEVEDEVRRIQSKAEFLDELESQVDILTVLDFLSTNAPVDVVFEQLTVSNQVFNVDGVAYSQDSLAKFLDTVRGYPEVVDVSIERITQTENSTGTNFKLRIDFSQPETEEVS